MTGNRSTGDDKPVSHSEETLRKIADAVGIPVSFFHKALENGSEMDQTLEMLQLWAQMGKSADRRKLLAFARALVGVDTRP